MQNQQHDHSSRRDEPFYRLEGQLDDMVVIGPVPDGVRMNGYFSGTLTAGALRGATVSLVDYFRIRADGVGVVDAHETVELDGQRVAVKVVGYVLPPDGSPAATPEEVAAPGFAFPDAPSRIEAFATFQTAAPGLAYLNSTAVFHTGSVNLATGELTVEAHRFPKAPARRESKLAAAH